MAEQRHTPKTNARRTADTHGEADSRVAVPESAERLRDEIDSLLDEIDDVLETNAEEFVKNYVQKGGQ